jgi:LPS sulfotransferase NodH
VSTNRPSGNGSDAGGNQARLAWIFGSSRSGSTWLLRMLADTGDVGPIDDPHIGHHLGVWRPIPLAWAAAREFPELTTLTDVKRDKPDYFFSDRYRDEWMPALRHLIESRFTAQVRDQGHGDASAIVVKEPGSHAADLLLELFPDSSVVFLLRDGRDVVDSWVDAYQRGSWAQEEGAFAVAPEGRLALVRWLSSVWRFRTETVQRAFAGQAAHRRVLVRYEELLADTAGQLERVADTLDLSVSPARLERIAADHAYERVSPAARGDGKAVRMARPGGWRQNLSREEQSAMLEILGPKLAELGYAPARVVAA